MIFYLFISCIQYLIQYHVLPKWRRILFENNIRSCRIYNCHCLWLFNMLVYIYRHYSNRIALKTNFFYEIYLERQQEEMNKHFHPPKRTKSSATCDFMRFSYFETWPFWICQIWPPKREPSLAPAKSEISMVKGNCVPKMGTLDEFEQSCD